MSAHFVVAPQWQGSGSTRAMRLIDGAEAIRGDLPSASTRVVDLPTGAGESLGTGVHRFSSISTAAEAIGLALAETPGTPIVIGGDCGVEFASIRHAVSRADGNGLAVVWFDAHGDLNTPESSQSGAFHGMVLRTLLGDGPAELAAEPVVTPDRLVLAGTRALDDGEAAYIDGAGIPVVVPAQLADPSMLLAAVRATGAGSIYVHVDLDVLDPREITGVAFPEPFGIEVGQLTAAITALRSEFPLIGAAITEFAPSEPDAAVADLSTILRIVSALVR